MHTRWMTSLALALALALTLTNLACDSGDGDGDGDADGDGDGDADGDADGDGDGDAGPADCPRNSGWPCTCDRVEPCDDGARCAPVPEGTLGLGICTAECIPDVVPTETCPDTPQFAGSMGLCFLQESQWGDPTHCLLGCAQPNACPSDQRCVDLGISEELNFCVP